MKEQHLRRGRQAPDNRRKILLAAIRALTDHGYANTSIKDIARRAGVAQGLVHYYFKSKQQLLLAVAGAVTNSMNLSVFQGTAGVVEVRDIFTTGLNTTPDIRAVFLQLLAISLNNAEIAAAIQQASRAEHQQIKAIVQRVVAVPAQDQLSLVRLVAAIQSSRLGINIQSLIDGDFNSEAAIDGLGGHISGKSMGFPNELPRSASLCAWRPLHELSDNAFARRTRPRRA